MLSLTDFDSVVPLPNSRPTATVALVIATR